ncbi:carboxypeptidase-like regulatory domain-containing protein [Sphingobacterium sp. E70]|uniref:carboxypeptidase-like regulatory domain-containing protein n=1 Tax=Sphingobacterium sp. E70 TaxID=2853439 RepID=UPI00211C9996|nr:carboxypeptidase-like regulatory domain-containing protein [Sphingobacterium sp. E70]ULT23034.1 carboxypeptidase-like regulatory domain-containing protein [Sphingobacterium sp. E70]
MRESGTNTTLAGVNVRVKGRTGGTVTNSNGKYEIPIDSKESILVFTYTGKKTEERLVGENDLINVSLTDESNMLAEVYVGYMTQRKADLTGSVAIANASDIARNPSANAMKSLQEN